jgi:hypothetical protein
MCLTINACSSGSAVGSGISAETAASMCRGDNILLSNIIKMCACGSLYTAVTNGCDGCDGCARRAGV